jgi:hypothetical protein
MNKIFILLASMLLAFHTIDAQWTELGSGSHALNANNIILAVAAGTQGNVYAAGEFSDSNKYFYVAQWSGDTAWFPLDTGGSSPLKANNYIYALATDPAGHVYAAGAFTDAQFVSTGHVYVAEWLDTGWAELGATGVASATVAETAIYTILADGSGNVYAAGSFKDGNNKFYVDKWNGAAWSELGTGGNALNANGSIRSIAVDAAGNIYAAGNFTDGNGLHYVAEWNGATWSELGTGSAALDAVSPIHAITADPSGHVYVAYDDTTANFYVAEWNGSSWSQVGTGANALNPNNAINVLTTDAAGNLYAAGNFTDINGTQFVAKWNDTTWSELGTNGNALNPNSYILAIAVDSAYNVYAGGYFTDGNNNYYVAEYDPNTQTLSGIDNIAPAAIGMTVIPNPSSANASIMINAAATSDFAISAYDMTGREVAEIYQGQLAAGANQLAFNTTGLSAGLYIVKATNGNATIQKRFVKM